MTPVFVPESFERVMGCTVADLLSWLPLALPCATLTVDTVGSTCRALLADGTVQLTWRQLPAMRIAMLEIPRLNVRFVYAGLPQRGATKCKKDLTW